LCNAIIKFFIKHNRSTFVGRFFFDLNQYTSSIFNSASQLPSSWDEVAVENVFLQKAYLKALENAPPTNMQCLYVGIFNNTTLIGVAIVQYLDLNKLTTFGDRDKCLKTIIRNFVFKNLAGHVLILGNNMVTGQNSYHFNTIISSEEKTKIILDYTKEIKAYLKNKGIKIHLVTFKDFYLEETNELKQNGFQPVFEIHAQPNMIFNLPEYWKSKENYIGAFTKKYRDQYKRARKKFTGIITEELSFEKIVKLEDRIYQLYEYVARNAPFNTFFLAKNHFSILKKECSTNFKVIGYFEKNNLVGFHTIFLNGNTLETCFLGYDEKVQKEKMLYLNMLYNMTEYGIENNFKRIIFGRTALEIKSSIGAEPIMMSGFMYHQNYWINKLLPKIYRKLEPKLIWQQRHPFKEI